MVNHYSIVAGDYSDDSIQTNLTTSVEIAFYGLRRRKKKKKVDLSY